MLDIVFMPQYARLSDENRVSRRSIADAIEVLREAVNFQSCDRARTHIGLLALPSGDVVGLIDLQFEAPGGETIYCVSLPTSASFRGVRRDMAHQQDFEISKLHGAVIEGIGDVTLGDGTAVRGVTVSPYCWPLKPSELDWRILRCTISASKGEHGCFRYLGEGLPPHYQEMVPNELRFVDCGRLSKLKVPYLKVIAGHFADRFPNQNTPSEQKIADTLRMFGARLPKSRPRQIGHASAAF